MVVPDGHDENHSSVQGFAHRSKTSQGLEIVGVADFSLLSGAESVSDGIACDSWEIRIGVRNGHSVLDIESLDLVQSSRRSSVLLYY